jgi:hypothetical protein
MRANPTRTIIATTYDLVPSEIAETRMVPATAVPNDEPRFEMLRERPEISPCRASGKLDWTTLTDGVNIAPTPSPNRNRPRRNARVRSEVLMNGIMNAKPMAAARNPAAINARCEYRFARPRAANEEIRTPAVADVKIRPVLIGLYPCTSCR